LVTAEKASRPEATARAWSADRESRQADETVAENRMGETGTPARSRARRAVRGVAVAANGWGVSPNGWWAGRGSRRSGI
jgi:hypothetical protein